MQQAAPERSALICQDLHPQAACCALFLDAILKDDWRLVRRAMKTLESMYDEELISPTEAGYVLCCVIPSNFRTVQSMDVPIGPDERLPYAQLDDWSQRPFLRSVLQRVVKEGWLCQEEEEKACGAYQSLLKEKLAELCATNFATTSSDVYRIDRSRLARLIDMLAALDAKATGEAIATISRAVSACRNGSFGYVRYATARKRILDLFEAMAEDFPNSVGVMSGWVGLDKQLDKAILKALSGKLNDLV